MGFTKKQGLGPRQIPTMVGLMAQGKKDAEISDWMLVDEAWVRYMRKDPEIIAAVKDEKKVLGKSKPVSAKKKAAIAKPPVEAVEKPSVKKNAR